MRSRRMRSDRHSCRMIHEAPGSNGSGAMTIGSSNNLGLGDVDAKAFEADIVALARGDQVDRGNAEIFQDLRAQADLAPFVLTPAGLFMILAVATLRPLP